MEISDAKKRKYTQCLRRMKSLGFSDIEAQIHCSQYVTKDSDGTHTDDFNLLFIDGDEEIEDSDEYISNKISILHEEYPDWKHEKVVATAYGYYKQKQDAVSLSKMFKKAGGVQLESESKRFRNISLSKFATLVRYIRTKVALKKEHMALGTQKIELPMQGANRLQTKMEKLVTEEQKYLTAEEQEKRSRYAKAVKKDSEDVYMEILEESIKAVIEKYKKDEDLDEKIFDAMVDFMQMEEVIWVDNTSVIEKANTGLNNIIKAPVILAREMIQEYKFYNDSGEERIETHFKDYDELAKAIVGLKKLYMILEHQNSWEIGDTLGCVRQLKADPNIRAIRGTAYFVESQLPVYIKDALKEGKTIAVSIGFMADLGPSGEFNGQRYDHVQRNIILDHLAVCVNSKPRCPTDQCGVNTISETMTDGEIEEKITIINKPDYYYTIRLDDFFDNKKESEIINKKQISDGDIMDDSFPDPKTGKTAGVKEQGEKAETEDLQAFLSGLRKFMAGISDPDEKASVRRMMLEITGFGKSEKMEQKKTKIGDNKMEEKEFEDAIALKDAEIKKLKDMIRGTKIKSIKSVTELYTDAELEEASLEKLEIYEDAAFRFAPSDEKTPVIPIEGKDEEKFKEVIEDNKEVKRKDPRKIFADTNEEFNLGGLK